MGDVDIRIEGRAGRITLTRPEALNALSAPMIPAIRAALEEWRGNELVTSVIFDSAGDKAFCAGGDIAELYARGRAGDHEFGRAFWRAEYRLNAQIAQYPKPTVSLLQGFTLGGGVGIGCHCRHRVVCDGAQIAMPEVGIGLVPDVGGSLILARAPGHLGEYLGLTGARMGPGDAIHAGFADHFIARADWPALIAALSRGYDAALFAQPPAAPPPGPLPAAATEIDHWFAAETVADILQNLSAAHTDLAAQARKAILRNSPLSMAAALRLIRQVRQTPTIRDALAAEYRFTARATERGDFLEGIRAAIIDKDRAPRWHHAPGAVPHEDVAAMLAPLGAGELTWEDRS